MKFVLESKMKFEKDEAEVGTGVRFQGRRGFELTVIQSDEEMNDCSTTLDGFLLSSRSI